MNTLRSKFNPKSDGFSIIEVMIVLAVAAVIMVIVFLAVPALQRNNRNTQRRTDVNNIVGAVNEYAANNGGKLPAATADYSSNIKFGIYGSASSLTTQTTLPTTANASASSVYVVTTARCDDQTTPTKTNATSRQFAAVFWVETSGGGTQIQCLEG